MFKAIKEFFTGKKAEEVATQAPYKVETPVAERLSAPASEARQSAAPAAKLRTRKPAPKRAAAAKKPAAPKAQ